MDNIRIEIIRNRVKLLIEIDYSLAVDLISIKLLVDELRCFGFSESVFAWIESFLSNCLKSSHYQIERNVGVP